MNLVLTHKNGKKSTLIPISFDYDIIHMDQPEYYDNGWFIGYKTDHYSNIDISKLWDIQQKSTFTNQIDYGNFHCKIKNKKQCKHLFEIFNVLMDHKKMPYKCDIVSEGELNFIDKPTKMIVLGIEDTVNKMKIIMHNCVPTYYDDSGKFDIKSDFVEIKVG